MKFSLELDQHSGRTLLVRSMLNVKDSDAGIITGSISFQTKNELEEFFIFMGIVTGTKDRWRSFVQGL